MKTAKEIAEEFGIYFICGEFGWDDVILCMKMYAKQVAEQALLDASENAMMYCVDREPEGVDKDSILNTLIKLP